MQRRAPESEKESKNHKRYIGEVDSHHDVGE
jgi:hypothetical protein